MSWIGRNVPRLEDPVLVRGEGRYVADAAVGARCVRFVRSPLPAGRITDIQRPDRLAPGALVVTGEDLEAVRSIVPRLQRFNYIAVEQPVLPLHRVSFVGQALAAVVADTPSAAEDLAEEVFVDIEPDEPVVDLDGALLAGAPAVHPQARATCWWRAGCGPPAATQPFPAHMSSNWTSARGGRTPRRWNAVAAMRRGTGPAAGSL